MAAEEADWTGGETKNEEPMADFRQALNAAGGSALDQRRWTFVGTIANAETGKFALTWVDEVLSPSKSHPLRLLPVVGPAELGLIATSVRMRGLERYKPD